MEEYDCFFSCSFSFFYFGGWMGVGKPTPIHVEVIDVMIYEELRVDNGYVVIWSQLQAGLLNYFCVVIFID